MASIHDVGDALELLIPRRLAAADVREMLFIK
jgi:hypothetical protein